VSRSPSEISGSSQRPPVLIIGAHRSGTTATARALDLLGLQLGQRLDSHHEPRDMQRLHDHYLESAGAAWHRPEPFLKQVATAEGERGCVAYLQNQAQGDFGTLLGYRRNLKGWWLRKRMRSGRAWGWKEPRTTLFAPCWLQVFPEARVVDVVRHPLAVAMSIRQRELKFRAQGDSPKPGLDQLDYCLRLALTYVEAGGRVASHTPNYRRVRFEEIQANPVRALEELANFCGVPPTPADLAQAAASIRPENSQWRKSLPEETARQLISSHPMVEKLGYG
jgi:hypothetical protein